MREFTMNSILMEIANYMYYGLYAYTGRVITKRNMMKLVEQGYVTSLGFTEQADGDGFIYSNRCMREGYILTDKGKRYLFYNVGPNGFSVDKAWGKITT